MRRRPVMTYCVINGVGRMSCRIGRWVFAKLAVSSNSWGCLLGLLAQSQALSCHRTLLNSVLLKFERLRFVFVRFAPLRG